MGLSGCGGSLWLPNEWHDDVPIAPCLQVQQAVPGCRLTQILKYPTSRRHPWQHASGSSRQPTQTGPSSFIRCYRCTRLHMPWIANLHASGIEPAPALVTSLHLLSPPYPYLPTQAKDASKMNLAKFAAAQYAYGDKTLSPATYGESGKVANTCDMMEPNESIAWRIENGCELAAVSAGVLTRRGCVVLCRHSA